MEKNKIQRLEELKKYKKTDLKFFRERLDNEKEHLKDLYQLSNGVEHSGTMDCKKEIKRLETIVEYLETAQEVPVQEQLNKKEKALNYLATSFSEPSRNSQLTKHGNSQVD